MLYNGKPHHPEMMVVPFMIENYDNAIQTGILPDCIEKKHTKNGNVFLVAYAEISKYNYDAYMNEYYKQVQIFSNNYKKIKSSQKPKSNIGNDELQNSLISLNNLNEENEPYTLPSYENLIFGELLADAAKFNPAYALIIQRRYQGYSNKEIIDMLPFTNSKGYKAIREALQFTKNWLTE